MLKLRWTFLLAVLVGMAGVIIAALATRTPPSAEVQAHALPGNISVPEQVLPAQLADLAGRGFRMVVDLRPDGEAADQPSSLQMGEAARAAGVAFAYIPVPHGTIPAEAVNRLGQVLGTSQKPVLLYCRSGSRAARTWALAEASRPGGLDERAILQAVEQTGLDASDLQADIARRIAARTGAAR